MPLLDYLPFRRQQPQRRKFQGTPGFQVLAGYVQTGEVDGTLGDHTRRYQLYRSILVNTSIVAASTRYFLNLIGKAEWSFERAEGDTDGRYAELLEEMLTSDPRRPWHGIVRSAATHRFYGFSVQEWIVRRREDGVITLHNVANRMQHTIDRWDVDLDGEVTGIIQRNPQNGQYVYLPRAKCLYLVDDSLSDSPEGIGLLRHLVRPYDRLTRYEQLEGIGFDTDLRGIPVVWAPLSELEEEAENGADDGETETRLKGLKDFLSKHVRGLATSVLMDSSIYRGEGDNQNASAIRKYGFELVKGGQTALPDMATAIDRVNREMARVLGAEQLLLGETSAGSFALSKDKTNQFYLLVDSSLTTVKEQAELDIIDPLWRMNAFPEEMKPTVKTEAIRSRDVEEIATALRDLATAGATLELDDPVIDEVRALMGVSGRPDGGKMAARIHRMMAAAMQETMNEEPEDGPPDDDE